MNHLRRNKMNKDAIELVILYPEMATKLNNDYRIELFKEYAQGIDSEILSKTEEIARLYNIAKVFKITQPLQPLMEILDVPLSTVNRRLHMARDKGLVVKISGDQKKAP